MNPQPTTSERSAAAQLVRFDALGAADARGLALSPASILVEFVERPGSMFPARVLAVGSPGEVDVHEAARSPRVRTVNRRGSILIPGLVNAHTHLDLTHIGPQPHDPVRGFMPWIDLIRSRRETDPARIGASVQRGIVLSLAAGTVAVGDIAGAARGRITLEPWRTLRDSPLVGVSWLEFFGIGKGLPRSEAMLEQIVGEIDGTVWASERTGKTENRVRVGFQPHAPNTVARSLYLKAIAQSSRLLGAPHAALLSTHLAESPEEREFVARACGPQRELLENLGLWDDAILADLGKGLHPVEHLRPILERTPFTVAHVNDADDAAIETLARTRTRVVYCPRASAYFGAQEHFGPHRYRDMLRAGICVALGTDSLVNLPPEAGRTPEESPAGRGMSILDEIRFLYARDGTPPTELLAMATTNGARALGLDATAFRFEAGNPLAGLVAVPMTDEPSESRDPGLLPWRIVSGTGIPQLLFASNYSDSTEV